MLKFKVGDKVKVMSGKDKGREGNIEKIYPEKKTAVLPGINIYKKQKVPQGCEIPFAKFCYYEDLIFKSLTNFPDFPYIADQFRRRL